MVFHVFLMSDLYLSNVEAKNCCLSSICTYFLMNLGL